jgi:HD-like signal output (HDOD) protein/GGDEF domain-containing protein
MSDPAMTLERFATRAGQLYSLPSVAMKVLELTENPQVDTRALKECIENDPALTGKILRVVNSSLFGLTREVSDLNQALALLGTKPLKLLVLGFSLPSGMFLGVEAKTLAWYWRRTLTKAIAGREISEMLWRTAGDDAFIAGLLQDLGMLVLLQQLGEPYARFLDRVVSSGADLGAMESKALGFTHTMLSARLLARWGLPGMLVEAVAWEPAGDCDATLSAAEAGGTPAPQAETPRGHEPHAGPPLAQVLHLAELLARLLADAQPGTLPRLLRAGHDYQGFSQDRLESLVGDLEEKVRQLAAVLSLQLPDGLEYRDVLAQAHGQLAQVAGQAAEDLLRTGQDTPERLEEEGLLEEFQDLADAISATCLRPAEAEVTAIPVPPDSGSTGSPRRAVDALRRSTTACPTRPGTAAPAGLTAATADAADPGLVGRLTLAVAACRRSRHALSLLLTELTHSDRLMVALGVEGFEALRHLLETVCRRADHPGAVCVAHGEAGFALILPDCERHAGVELGDQLIRAICGRGPRRREMPASAVGLAVGVATVALPTKNFPPHDLLRGAERCLYGSHASGGGVVKSIEIY